MTMLMMVKIMK